MNINDLAKKQYKWTERVGWHNKTVLETLGLLASEVGEAINECRNDEPTENFATELADIILRTVDIAEIHNIDLEEAIRNKMSLNEINGTRGRKK